MAGCAGVARRVNGMYFEKCGEGAYVRVIGKLVGGGSGEWLIDAIDERTVPVLSGWDIVKSSELDLYQEFVGLKAGDGFVLGCVVRSCVLTRIWLIVLAVVGMC